MLIGGEGEGAIIAGWSAEKRATIGHTLTCGAGNTSQEATISAKRLRGTEKALQRSDCDQLHLCDPVLAFVQPTELPTVRFHINAGYELKESGDHEAGATRVSNRCMCGPGSRSFVWNHTLKMHASYIVKSSLSMFYCSTMGAMGLCLCMVFLSVIYKNNHLPQSLIDYKSNWSLSMSMHNGEVNE